MLVLNRDIPSEKLEKNVDHLQIFITDEFPDVLDKSRYIFI